MAKNKQQKKKERERRVAQKKLAATIRMRAQAKAAKESEKTVSKTKNLITSMSVPKNDYVPDTKRNPFTQRRSGGYD